MLRQNYICPVASNYSVPVAVGAVAFLYNVSCIAANCQDILSTLLSKALQFPLPLGASDGLAPFDLSGHHYFATNTTPVFNLNASPDPCSGSEMSQSNSGTRGMLTKKVPGRKRFLGEKGSWEKKIPGRKRFLGEKGSWEKKIPGRKRFLGEKDSWEKKVPGRKRFLGEKGSWEKKVPGRKRFLGEKGSWEKKIPGRKRFLGEKDS
jgi:hypothetical protein